MVSDGHSSMLLAAARMWLLGAAALIIICLPVAALWAAGRYFAAHPAQFWAAAGVVAAIVVPLFIGALALVGGGGSAE
jgi:hypothetical protein